MTDNIRALLEELREIDIETWKDVRFHLINIFSVNDLGDINLRSPLLQNAYSDIIQGCIQRAIVDMELGYRQGTDSYKEDQPYAEIFETSESHISDHISERMISLECAVIPSAAILAAYVTARKAMK